MQADQNLGLQFPEKQSSASVLPSRERVRTCDTEAEEIEKSKQENCSLSEQL